MIESIDHFVITVADLKATLAFYATVLGFRFPRPDGNLVEIGSYP